MTGSVSVALMPQVLLVLRQVATEVHVLMSRAAEQFVQPATMALYAGHPVYTDGSVLDYAAGAPHIDLTDRADLFLVMPATANILAKAAFGIGDGVVSTAVLASDCPVVFAPSMNERMWRNPAIRHAVSVLRERKLWVIEPTMGREIGDLSATFGVMPGIELVLAELVEHSSPPA